MSEFFPTEESVNENKLRVVITKTITVTDLDPELNPRLNFSIFGVHPIFVRIVDKPPFY